MRNIFFALLSCFSMLCQAAVFRFIRLYLILISSLQAFLGSRYFNPLIETSSSKPATHAAHLLPPVRAAATFGFIPSMPGKFPCSIFTNIFREKAIIVFNELSNIVF